MEGNIENAKPEVLEILVCAMNYEASYDRLREAVGEVMRKLGEARQRARWE